MVRALSILTFGYACEGQGLEKVVEMLVVHPEQPE
jgi:hypothetical protein